jgi:hypothetical protein
MLENRSSRGLPFRVTGRHPTEWGGTVRDGAGADLSDGCRTRRSGTSRQHPSSHDERGEDHSNRKVSAMATGETGFDDVSFDLISLQYHSLKAGHDYGQYVRDARNAGREEIATFFEQVMAQDSERAKRCHEFLRELSGSEQSGPALT